MFGVGSLGLLGAQQSGGGGALFSPADLFASGEQGAWFDPSDLSTMFQDSTGTTPVTADGQPVGLILDKSKGLVLGAEKVTNGTFDTTTTGWTSGSSTISIDTSRLKIIVAGTYGWAYQGIPTVIGRTYKLSWSFTNVDATAGYIWVDPSAGLNAANFDSGALTNGNGSGYFVATATTTYVKPLIAGDTKSAFFDNMSVKEIAGNHASQATAAARPLYKTSGLAKYNDYDVVDDVLNTTFPSSLGSSCTVAKAVVGGSPTILTGQTIGTSWAESTDNAGLIIIDRALTGQETTDLTAWLTAKGATA